MTLPGARPTYPAPAAGELNDQAGGAPTSAYYADLERLEIALCDREPYLRIGAFWQLVARKPAWAVSLGT